MTLAGSEGQLKGGAAPEALLVRVVTFRASHHYRRSDWEDAENRRVFGAQGEPHEHRWRLEIEIAGPIAPHTGWVVDLGILDRALREVLDPLDGADLNRAVPDVAAGLMMPSTEALARWMFQQLQPAVPAPARLHRVRLFESEDLGAAYPVEPRSPRDG